MNDSVAENVYEEIQNRTLHNSSKHNESFSHFKGSIEVNMFNSKFNNMENIQQSTKKLINNDELNFSNDLVIKDNNNEISRSNKSFYRKGTQIYRNSKKYEKNMSLDMLNSSSSKMMNKIENFSSEKNNIKSVRSKKFLIPLDPNLYKVDMEEVNRKFLEMKKNKSLKRINSSKLLQEKHSFNEEKNFKKDIDTKTESNYDHLKNSGEISTGANPAKLQENLEYLKTISQDNEKYKKLSVIIENKEISEEIKNQVTSEQVNKNIKHDEVKTDIKETIINNEDKSKANDKSKSKERINSTKAKELNKLKKINPKNMKVKIEKDFKSINNKLEVKITSKTPSKKLNTSKININIKDKKSPEKDKSEPSKQVENNTNLVPPKIFNITPVTLTSSSSNETANLNNNTNSSVSIEKQRKEPKEVNKSFKSTTSEKDENEQKFCYYCIKKLESPIVLSCKHKLCYECAMEIHYLNEYLKFEKVKSLKCPKCDEKTTIKTTIEDLKVKNWVESKNNKSKNKQPSSICEICPTSKAVNEYAEFECLNCDILCCYNCKLRHISNPRHTDHKLIKINSESQNKIELILCEEHREPFKLYCVTDNKHCCTICSTDSIHENHIMKSCKVILENANLELHSALKETESKIRVIETLCTDLSSVKMKLEEEKDNFMLKLEKMINNVITIVKERQSQIEKKISHIFSKKMSLITTKLDAYNLISNRYNYYKNMVCDLDIDILERIRQLKKLNSKIHKIPLIDRNNNNIDLFSSLQKKHESSLKQSLFSFDPSPLIKKRIDKFDFIPFSQHHLDTLKTLFNNSTTVSPELISNDILLVLPRIKSGCLLYRISKDISSPQNFHKFCDNKGPTILIIKTIDGYVFGGYNPISWISEYMYNETENAFLFSLTDGKYRKPLKCPIYKTMKRYAVKQNENDYSPGFGETDNADLFIAFKNLKNSYSRLDNVYKCPKGYKPEEFLAGKPNDWRIEDVEVYAVEVSNDKEEED